MPFLEGPHRLEYEWIGPPPDETPTVVMLHHGLGSVSAWREFPRAVAGTTGLGVLAYSRRGYGRSAPAAAAPGVDFMHREATGDLPRILGALEIRQPILLGQSDGASIAIIYAATGRAPHPLGLVLMAPHVFVEECTVAAAARARRAYQHDDLRERLAKHHTDVDAAFYGWNTAWLDPSFRRWNIEAEISRVRCPITTIQGTEDEYGTTLQLDAVRDRARGEVETVVLDQCGHGPHRDQEQKTLAAIRRHVVRVTRGRQGQTTSPDPPARHDHAP